MWERKITCSAMFGLYLAPVLQLSAFLALISCYRKWKMQSVQRWRRHGGLEWISNPKWLELNLFCFSMWFFFGVTHFASWFFSPFKTNNLSKWTATSDCLNVAASVIAHWTKVCVCVRVSLAAALFAKESNFFSLNRLLCCWVVELLFVCLCSFYTELPGTRGP